jgi:hypothetical protein
MCAFTGFALVLVSIGAGAYDNVLTNVENNSELRLPLTFISNKIHQSDELNSINLIDKDGTTALVLKSRDKDNLYENWIFVYDGNLCELLIKSGDTFKWEDGVIVMPVGKFKMQIESSDLIKIESFNSKGESLELKINLRSL